MFEKESKKRISASEIIQTPYFRKVAQNFLLDQGRIRELAIPIEMAPAVKQEEEMSQSGQEDTWKTINSMGSCTKKNSETLTPKQKAAQRK